MSAEKIVGSASLPASERAEFVLAEGSRMRRRRVSMRGASARTRLFQMPLVTGLNLQIVAIGRGVERDQGIALSRGASLPTAIMAWLSRKAAPRIGTERGGTPGMILTNPGYIPSESRHLAVSGAG
jgi:hypothetical protein